MNFNADAEEMPTAADALPLKVGTTVTAPVAPLTLVTPFACGVHTALPPAPDVVQVYRTKWVASQNTWPVTPGVATLGFVVPLTKLDAGLAR